MRRILICFLAFGLFAACPALAQEQGGFPGPSLEKQLDQGAPRTAMEGAEDLEQFELTSWYYDYIISNRAYINRINFTASYETALGHPSIIFTTHSRDTQDAPYYGNCWNGADFSMETDYHCMWENYDVGTNIYMDFDLDGNTGSGIFYYEDINSGTYSDTYNLYMTKRYATCDCSPEDSTTYCVPFIPGGEDFGVGFGLSNAANDAANTVTISYYDNDGNLLDQEEPVTITAGSQTSFSKSMTTNTDGWAYITTTEPLTGMSLIYDLLGLFDVDLTSDLSTSLIVSHMDTGSWTSTAMLCNPNDAQADVTLTFHAQNTGATSTRTLSIPAMGSVQYDLSDFGGAGAVEIDSNQALAGFLLYDGRDSGYNWLGGLSIQNVN